MHANYEVSVTEARNILGKHFTSRINRPLVTPQSKNFPDWDTNYGKIFEASQPLQYQMVEAFSDLTLLFRGAYNKDSQIEPRYNPQNPVILGEILERYGKFFEPNFYKKLDIKSKELGVIYLGNFLTEITNTSVMGVTLSRSTNGLDALRQIVTQLDKLPEQERYGQHRKDVSTLKDYLSLYEGVENGLVDEITPDLIDKAIINKRREGKIALEEAERLELVAKEHSKNADLADAINLRIKQKLINHEKTLLAQNQNRTQLTTEYGEETVHSVKSNAGLFSLIAGDGKRLLEYEGRVWVYHELRELTSGLGDQGNKAIEIITKLLPNNKISSDSGEKLISQIKLLSNFLKYSETFAGGDEKLVSSTVLNYLSLISSHELMKIVREKRNIFREAFSKIRQPDLLEDIESIRNLGIKLPRII